MCMLKDLKRRTKHFVETMVAGLPCRVVNGPGPELVLAISGESWIAAVCEVSESHNFLGKPAVTRRDLQENVQLQKQRWIFSSQP